MSVLKCSLTDDFTSTGYIWLLRLICTQSAPFEMQHPFPKTETTAIKAGQREYCGPDHLSFGWPGQHMTHESGRTQNTLLGLWQGQKSK